MPSPFRFSARGAYAIVDIHIRTIGKLRCVTEAAAEVYPLAMVTFRSDR